MSEEKKAKTPAEKELENKIGELKKIGEQLQQTKKLVEITKEVLETSKKELKAALDKIESVKLWAEGFERFSDSDYKGSFIAEEIKKVLKEKPST